MVSDSAIQLIIGNKIIIGILKPILLLSIVKLIQVKPEYIQIVIIRRQPEIMIERSAFNS